MPDEIIQYCKKLVLLEDLPGPGVRFVFADQTKTIADIVVGADEIPSVRHLFQKLSIGS